MTTAQSAGTAHPGTRGDGGSDAVTRPNSPRTGSGGNSGLWGRIGEALGSSGMVASPKGLMAAVPACTLPIGAGRW